MDFILQSPCTIQNSTGLLADPKLMHVGSFAHTHIEQFNGVTDILNTHHRYQYLFGTVAEPVYLPAFSFSPP